MDTNLTAAEMAALRSIDAPMQPRLDQAVEDRLTQLGLIERVKLGGGPSRTAKGDEVVARV